MKFCYYLHESLYLDDYNGSLYFCPWMKHSETAIIGNITHQSIEDAYNSDNANFLRSTMDDQTFRYCRCEACPHLQNNDLEEITADEYERRKKKRYYPTSINLAYDYVCNLSCETCRKTVFMPPSDYAEKMDLMHNKIASCLDTAKSVSASGHGDPFASKYMMKVLENLRPSNPDFTITLETNGVFFDREHWERIKHLGKFNFQVIVTINSFDEFTYKHISRGGNYQKMLNNLDFISQLRVNGDIKKLMSTMVVQDRNFRELPAFIKRCFDDYSFDSVVLKPVYQWGTMDEDVCWFKNVRNPLHPYHQEYLEIMQDPILKDSRVYDFGGNMVTEAHPYPSTAPANFIFPYDKVGKNSKVVIYGAGQAGREFVRQLKHNCYCKVVLWVDKNFDGETIMSPTVLKNMPQDGYDYIVLATKNDIFASEMKQSLNAMGIAETQIVFNHL